MHSANNFSAPCPSGERPDRTSGFDTIEDRFDLQGDTHAAPATGLRLGFPDDYIVCLEDGKKLKTLKRHLMTEYGMAPEAYRAKWGLKPVYPMVAPNYSRKRQELAKKFGLGRKPRSIPPAPKPTPKRSRTKAAAA